MIPETFCVQKIREETHDSFTLNLIPQNAKPDFGFAPGQFNMLYAFGKGEVPISISGDPADRQALIHTIRRVGSVTQALGDLKAGDCVGVRGPFGSHWPVELAEGKDIVIVTGGIGLAPLRPALYSLLHARQKYGRIVLLYGARSPDDILYREELQKWRSRLDLEVRVIVDHARDGWHGSIGVVTGLIPKADFDPSNSMAFLCGPEIMMRFTLQELLKNGMNKEDIYLSMERNMKCGIGHCGHCQYGPRFICKDGPVFNFRDMDPLFSLQEL